MVFFYLVTTVWIFDMSLCENSTKKSIKKSRACLRERNFLLFSFMNGNLLNVYIYIYSMLYLKKNQNAPRPSEHPPVRGKKCFRCKLLRLQLC